MSEIRVENIIGETGVDAVKFTKGINVTGIVTATNVSIGSSVTATSFFGSGAGLSGVSAGKILQVVSTVKSDVFSTTSQTFTDITGLSATITPSNSNNKVFVMAVIGSFNNTDAVYIALTDGNNNAIIQGDSASNRISCSAGAYSGGNSTGEGWYGANSAPIFKLHSPNTTSAFTYKCRIHGNNGNTVYVNRNQSDSSNQYGMRVASTITLMEVEV
tara:strand:+ start:215 stop:862 length:648 start_codon:yes stop_codon:yes gene_type:complete